MPQPASGAPPQSLLVYTHALAGGGAERVCALLASGFAQRGWRVTMAVDFESADNAAYLDPAVGLVVLGASHGPAVLRLARLIRQSRPDACLSAIGVSNVKLALAGALAGRLRRVVLSYHAFAVSEPQRLSQLAYRLLPLLSRVTGRTVAVSDGLRADLVGAWHSSARRTVTVHNPVVVAPDTSRVAPAPGEPPTVLAAGRLTPGKNMAGLLEAFARVVRLRPARLVILGEGPERAALEAQARALGIADRIALPGYCAEPWDQYRRAACFVSPSLAESFSMVIVEALRYGLPVVAVDCAGPREVLAEGRYGALVPPGDPDALAAAIVAALDRPGPEDGRRARGAVFSLDAALDGYGRLFEAVKGCQDPVGSPSS